MPPSIGKGFCPYLYSQRDLLELAAHAVEFLNIAPGPHEVLGLDLGGTHLALLRTLLDLPDERLFLLLKLDPDLVEFADRLVEHTLVFAQALGWRHTLAECPFENLQLSAAVMRQSVVGHTGVG